MNQKVPQAGVQYCPDGVRQCPKDVRVSGSPQNCSLCDANSLQPVSQPLSQPVPLALRSDTSSKILCYLDAPSGLPTTIPSIGSVGGSNQPYFIVYPTTDILMTCTLGTKSGLSTTNPCEFLGPPLVGDGKTSRLNRYVCEATRRKQLCDGKYTGVELQVSEDAPLLEPYLTKWRYGFCAPASGFTKKFSEAGDPKVLGEGEGAFYEFGCQPHMAEGAACEYSADSSNPYPYLAYNVLNPQRKKGRCVTIPQSPCRTKDIGIGIPRWAYAACPKDGVNGTPRQAPWASTLLGMWTGQVEIGDPKTHGRFYYNHAGMVPGPVKMCLPEAPAATGSTQSVSPPATGSSGGTAAVNPPSSGSSSGSVSPPSQSVSSEPAKVTRYAVGGPRWARYLFTDKQSSDSCVKALKKTPACASAVRQGTVTVFASQPVSNAQDCKCSDAGDAQIKWD